LCSASQAARSAGPLNSSSASVELAQSDGRGLDGAAAGFALRQQLLAEAGVAQVIGEA
jgi:hypothetical protein